MQDEIKTPDFSRANSQNLSSESESINIFDYSHKKLHKKKTPDWNIAYLQLKNEMIKEENENSENEEFNKINQNKNTQLIQDDKNKQQNKFDDSIKENNMGLKPQSSESQLYSFGRNKYEPYENVAQILEIQKFNSKQDLIVYQNYIELLEFLKNSQKIDAQKRKFNNLYSRNIQQIFIYQKDKKTLDQVKDSIIQQQKFLQDKLTQSKLIQFGFNFNQSSINQICQDMTSIEKTIQSKENTSFEIQKLFYYVFDKQAPEKLQNKELLKLIRRHLQNQQRNNPKNINNLNQNEIDILQNTILEYQQKEKIYQQDKDNLKELIQDMRESQQMQNDEIQQLQKQIDILQNQQLQQEEKKLEEDSTLQSNQDQNCIDQGLQDIQQQQIILLNNFSILFYLKTNFPQIQIQDIKNEFFEDIVNYNNLKKETSSSSEFFRTHLQSFLQIELDQNKGKDVKVLLDSILKQTGLQRLNQYQGSENSKQCGHDANAQNQSQSSEYILQDLDLQQKLAEEIKKNIALSQQQEKLSKDLSETKKKVEYQKKINQKLRLQNLQMIKLKKKFSQQQHQLESFKKTQDTKTLRNWGTQTIKPIIELSNDFDLIFYKKVKVSEQHQQRSSLRRQDSLRMFQKITLFHKKIEHYKSIIKELQYKLNDSRPLVSPRINLDKICYQLIIIFTISFEFFFNFLINKYKLLTYNLLFKFYTISINKQQMSCWNIEIFLDENLNKNFLCPFGKGVMNKPMMDGCGHQYCEYCLRTMIEKNMDCKVTEQPIKKPQKYVENLLASKLISNLKIKCTNFNDGCQWKGKLSMLSEHLLQDCIYQQVKCPKLNCNERIMRKDLKKHENECQYRIINCPECNEEIVFLDLKKHEDDCPKKDIQCPQQCGQIIKRKNVDNHLKNFCKNLTIHCPYHNCKIQGDRKSVQEHVFSKNGFIHHQNLLSDKVMNIESKLNLVNNFINSLKFQMQQQENKHKRIQDSQDKFDPFDQSNAIFVNNQSKKAIKIKNQGPTFVLINSFFAIDKTFMFRINCQSSLGIGLSTKQVVLNKNHIFDESKVFENTYLFKIISQMGKEDIFLELNMQEDNQQTNLMVLKNHNNQSITKLFIPKNEKSNLCPVLVLNNIGDSAEIILTNKEESEHDFFNDEKKLVISRNSSINQQQLIYIFQQF